MGRTIAAAVAGVAAAGAVFAVLASAGTSSEPRERRSPFPEVNARDVTELSIRSREREIRLRRRDDAWRLVAPVDDAADPRRVEKALAALARIELGGDPVATGEGSWPRYEVAEDEVLTAVVTQDGRPLPALHLGRSGFARVGEGESVYEVPEFRRDVLDLELADWRDLTILELEDNEVTAVEVVDDQGRRARADRAPGSEHENARSLPADAWVLTAGEEHADPFDPEVPSSLVRYLLALRGADVAEGASAREAIADPSLRIRLYSEGGIHELLVGDRVDTKTALAFPERDRIWLLSHPQAQQLARGPRQWRHKRLIDAEPGGITAIDVTQGERRLRAVKRNRWRLEHPHDASIDAAAADAYARGVSGLSADAVAEPDAELPEEIAELSFELRGGETLDLTIGARDDGTFVVSSSKRRDLVLLHRQRAETLLADAFALIRD